MTKAEYSLTIYRITFHTYSFLWYTSLVKLQLAMPLSKETVLYGRHNGVCQVMYLLWCVALNYASRPNFSCSIGFYCNFQYVQTTLSHHLIMYDRSTVNYCFLLCQYVCSDMAPRLSCARQRTYEYLILWSSSLFVWHLLFQSLKASV